MTPRSTAPSGNSPATLALHQAYALHEEAERATGELLYLLREVQQVVPESAEIRLTAVRAYLDRAEETRANLNAVGRDAHSLNNECDLLEREAFGEEVNRSQGQLVGRGMAAEERSATYLLRTKLVAREWNEVKSRLQEIDSMVKDGREIVKSIEGHRIEAITMLRANIRISADEYLVYRTRSQRNG